MKYRIIITWVDGTVTRADVTREALRGFKLRTIGIDKVKWWSL